MIFCHGPGWISKTQWANRAWSRYCGPKRVTTKFFLTAESRAHICSLASKLQLPRARNSLQKAVCLLFSSSKVIQDHRDRNEENIWRKRGVLALFTDCEFSVDKEGMIFCRWHSFSRRKVFKSCFVMIPKSVSLSYIAAVIYFPTSISRDDSS